MESSDQTRVLNHQVIFNNPLHQLFDSVDAIAVHGYDENRQVFYWNKGSELLYGYVSKETSGRKIEDLIIPKPMKALFIEEITRWFTNDAVTSAFEHTLLHKNGSEVCVFSSHVVFTNQDNKKLLYCIDINLTEVKRAQEQALFKEHLLEAAFEAIPDLFFLMNDDGTIIDYHASNTQNLYVTPEEFLGKPMMDILPTNVATKFKKNIATVISNQDVVSFEYALAMPQGLTYFEARISHLPGQNKVVTIIRDITEQHKVTEVIRHHAYYDTLTSLPNRFLSLDRLSQLLNKSKRNVKKIAVLFLDLDDFKKVNDTLGHEIGDMLLKESATRLNKTLRKEDTVGRLGGDEFIVLLGNINNDQNALSLAENILKTFREPFILDGRELMITISIGIAIYPENGKTVSELLRNADTAMYQAKSLGRNTYSFFTNEMNVTMLRRLEIEEQMHGALERNEFEVYYQPQISTKNNKVIGAEALLRWHNPVLRNIGPDEFIPVAENTGLIVPIGQFVVKQALSFLNKWQNLHQKKYKIAVNLSPRQFRDAEFISFIQQSLCDSNIEAGCLELEITEGVLMIGQSYIDDAIVKLNKLGIILSMDDFGTGYSSLSYLRQYSFDVLKIDRSFIQGIPKNKADCELSNAIIAMAQSLGLKIVAEGVETKDQVDLLTTLGCDYLQGYFFSKPVPAEQLIDFSANY